jgi:YidC/Oxa1 family membrane protein insertase
MDKNTIIGLLLITAIIVAFTIYNRPSKEQIAEQKRLRDSIALVEAQQAEIATELGSKQASTSLSEDSVLGQGSSLSDFFRAGTPYNEAINDSTSEVTILANEPVNEEIIVLENDKIRLLLNTKGGKIQSVQLKEYLHYKGDSLYLFENDQESRFNLELFNRNSLRISTENEYFTPIKSADGKTVIMRLQNSSEQYIDLVYTLPEDEYMLDFDIRISGMRNGLHPESLANFKLNWEQKVRQQEKGRAFENRYSRIHYKYDKQDDSKLSESKNDQKELPDPIKWFAFKDQYFSAIVIADKPFNNTILTSQLLNDSEYIKNYKAEVWAPVEISTESDLISAGFKYYFGPVHYNTLKSYDDGVSSNSDKLELEEIVSLGYKWLSWVNKWFVIPVFNYFLTLNWGMGLIILILTIMVKIIISPLTYKSYISSAKMRVLRPQIQEIEKKYPGQEQDMMMKRQQATMELYSKAGVSPMSGCLPMLIQMPVLLALFFFFPSAIELRQQSFLWADDLSTFDSLISWSGNIPIITRFLGNHISIFCLLMTITNVIYTYNCSYTSSNCCSTASACNCSNACSYCSTSACSYGSSLNCTVSTATRKNERDT